MSSTESLSASSTLTAIPTGTISALIGSPPNTTKDYYVVKYFLLVFGEHTSPLLGITIPPVRPDDYTFTTRGPGILAGMSAALAVMLLITVLRLFVRLCGRGLILGLDDLFIIPGVLLAITWPTLQIAAVIYGGAGKHLWDVTYEEYASFKYYANLSKAIFFVAVGMVKVSICLFNRRLTYMTSKSWLWFNNIFLGLLTVYILASLFSNIFECYPAYSGWDAVRVGREGIIPKCFSTSTLGTILSTIHVAMDFGLLAVPLIVLWTVKMGWKTKARLYFVFSIGMMSAVGSILRQIQQSKLGSDILYNYKPLVDWTIVDLTLGVVAASLPVLSAFIPARWRSLHTPSYDQSQTHLQLNASKFTGRKTSIGGSLMAVGRSMNGTGSGKGRGRERSDSEENIVRTDVIELSYQSKDEVERAFTNRDDEVDSGGCKVSRLKSSLSKGASGRTREREVRDGEDPRTWIGGVNGREAVENGYTVEISRHDTKGSARGYGKSEERERVQRGRIADDWGGE